jgi:hypothetical protein
MMPFNKRIQEEERQQLRAREKAVRAFEHSDVIALLPLEVALRRE